MANYGTKEFYDENIRANEIDKKILFNALIFEARKENFDIKIINEICKRICSANGSIDFAYDMLSRIDYVNIGD